MTQRTGERPTLRLSEFDYALPPERIAQAPLPQRDLSRLLVLDRNTGEIAHRHFFDLPEYLRAGDVLVLNDTRVSAQRLFGARPGRHTEVIETFLTHRVADGLWQALGRPGRKLPPGTRLEFGGGLSAEVLERTDDRGGRLLQFTAETGFVEDVIAAHGSAPLPPYITQPLAATDRERYQTVYGAQEGSAAAPTAGLHFTPELLARIEAQGVGIARVTLHVGMGTFRPIATEAEADITRHTMHAERVTVSAQAADLVNGARGAHRCCRHDLRPDPGKRRSRRPSGRTQGRRDEPVHHAGLSVPGGGCAGDELPHAPLNAAGAGERPGRR